jgi:hypothetical protein
MTTKQPFPMHSTLSVQLTKREQFAMAAMQGLFSNSLAIQGSKLSELVVLAVEKADELIEELNQPTNS